MLDLDGLTVVPGLIDCHAHLIGDLEASWIPAVSTTAAQEAFTGVRNARDTLMAGFTTVRDLGAYRAFVDVALRDAIDRGIVTGPRMAVAGAFVTVPGGGGALAGLAPDIELPPDLRFGIVTSVDDVRRVVRALLHGGADLIKVIATGAVLTRGTSPGASEMSEEEIRAAVEEAGRYGAFVAAHAHGAEGIKSAVRAGVRSIEHGSLIDDEGIELMLEHATYLVADIYCGDWIATEGRRQGWPADTLRKNDETTGAQRDGFRRAVAAGVSIAYGTDSGVYPHGRNAHQLSYMVRHGMTALGALRSATRDAAELMGWSDRVGAIAAGRYADLIAVAGDPLDEIGVLERPMVVVKGGVVVRDDRR
jgi:imidazolonepropionase-like amidohydrolase